MAKQNNQDTPITCKLGCINYHINSNGEFCYGQGLIPIRVCEGTRCQRGYAQAEMAKILAQEEAEDEILRQQGLLATLGTF